jgi:HlyD family secretion protein
MVMLWLGNMKNPLPILLGIMTGGVVLIGLMTVKLTETPTEQTQLEELTVLVTQESLPVEIEASGTVQPVERVNISPKTAGRLERLAVDQGMIVKKGQPLAVMENKEIFAQV